MAAVKTVLLVDDDEISLFLSIHVITKLKLKNLEVRNNGKEALEYLKNCESVGKSWPDLILLDLNMPEMDGTEFLQEYQHLDSPKKDNTRIVIVSTTRKNPLNQDICRHFGIDYYIEKPLSQSKMVEVLQNVPLKDHY